MTRKKKKVSDKIVFLFNKIINKFNLILERTDNEDTDEGNAVNEVTPESVPPLEKSPPPSDVEMEENRTDEEEDEREEAEEEDDYEEEHTEKKEIEKDERYAVNESPKSDVVMKDEALPPYFPAIQGCRSVEEFQCLNRIEEGTYGVVYRAQDKRTNDIVALKRLKMEKEKEGFPITSLREINTLLKVSPDMT